MQIIYGKTILVERRTLTTFVILCYACIVVTYSDRDVKIDTEIDLYLSHESWNFLLCSKKEFFLIYAFFIHVHQRVFTVLKINIIKLHLVSACHPACESCDGGSSKNCTSCYPGSRISKKGKCRSLCEKGQYMSLDGSCKGNCNFTCRLYYVLYQRPLFKISPASFKECDFKMISCFNSYKWRPNTMSLFCNINLKFG